MLICFFFHLVHIILYSWVGELKRRRKAIAVLYNKQDDATRDQLSSFSCLILFFAFFFSFLCIFLVFFSFSYFHPHQPPNAFYDCDVPFFFFVQSPFSSLLFPSPRFSSVNFCGKKKAFAMVLIPYPECYFYCLALGLDWIGWKDKKRAKKQKRINCRAYIAFFFFYYSIYTPPCMYMFLISNVWMIDSWLVLGIV